MQIDEKTDEKYCKKVGYVWTKLLRNSLMVLKVLISRSHKHYISRSYATIRVLLSLSSLVSSLNAITYGGTTLPESEMMVQVQPNIICKEIKKNGF